MHGWGRQSCAQECVCRTVGVPDCVCNEHILMALLAEESGATCKLLRRLGLDVGSMKEEVGCWHAAPLSCQLYCRCWW